MASSRDETPRVKTLVLDAEGWDDHRAGQHLDVRLTAEDGYQAAALVLDRLGAGRAACDHGRAARGRRGLALPRRRGARGRPLRGARADRRLLRLGRRRPGAGAARRRRLGRRAARGDGAPPRAGRLVGADAAALLLAQLGRSDLPRRARDAGGRGRAHAHARAAAGLARLRAADRRRAAARGRLPGLASGRASTSAARPASWTRPPTGSCGSATTRRRSGPSASERPADGGARRSTGTRSAGCCSSCSATELTAAPCICGSCGTRAELARLDVYLDCPGVVVRCHHCAQVLITIVRGPERSWVDLSGTRGLEL